MKPSFVPNSHAVDQFKQKIGYDQRIGNIVNDKKLQLNWEPFIEQSHFGTEKTWQIVSVSQYQLNHSLAQLSVTLEQGENSLDVKVQLLSGVVNAEALEYAIESLGVTSAMSINMDVSPAGPGELTLYSSGLPGISGESTLCVFKNSIIRLNASEPGPDIQPILVDFIQSLSPGLIDTSQEPIPPIGLSANKNIIAGDTFFIDLKVSEGDEIKLLEASSNIEMLGQDDRRFTFKANASGEALVTFGVMNRNTLYTNAVQWSETIAAP